MLRHSVPHFLLNFKGIECWVAALNAAISKMTIFFCTFQQWLWACVTSKPSVIIWELFTDSLNIPLKNLTHSMFFFSFIALTYDRDGGHHLNSQINIFTFLIIRRELMISISDALEYVHATVFFTFSKIYSRSPHRFRLPYKMYLYLLNCCYLRQNRLFISVKNYFKIILT